VVGGAPEGGSTDGRDRGGEEQEGVELLCSKSKDRGDPFFTGCVSASLSRLAQAGVASLDNNLTTTSEFDKEG